MHVHAHPVRFVLLQFFKLTSKCACPYPSGVCGKGGRGGGGSSDDGGSDPGVVGIVLMCL